MGFFENELKKMFGAKSPINDARFVGRACLGRLGETTNVKLQFVTLGVHERYEGIEATIFNRNKGVIDCNIFRFADILGKNVLKNNPNNSLPHIWASMSKGYEWYSYKPTTGDYAAVAKEVNNYLEVFLEQQQTPMKEKASRLYLLYWHGEWGMKSTAELKMITPDKETLYAAIGSEILSGNMIYLGESGGKGFKAYKDDYLAGVNVLKELDYGFVKEMKEALLSEPDSVPEYCTAASEYLAADFNFDPAEFDKAFDEETTKNDMTVLCDGCIRAIRSRGEAVFVGELVHDEKYSDCVWCKEPNEELYAVVFAPSISADSGIAADFER